MILPIIKRFIYRLTLLNKEKSKKAAPLCKAWQQTPLSLSQFSLTNKSTENKHYIVIDTETSSLSTKDGELLSIGWVLIEENKIKLNSARHYLLQPNNSVGNSAAIHQLRDCEFKEGNETSAIMKELIETAAGKTMVFHHAPLDTEFLNKACKDTFGLPLLWPTLDTLQIEKQKLERKNIPLQKNALRLASCRARYNLPTYPAHNALIDALATAELLLAQS